MTEIKHEEEQAIIKQTEDESFSENGLEFEDDQIQGAEYDTEKSVEEQLSDALEQIHDLATELDKVSKELENANATVEFQSRRALLAEGHELAYRRKADQLSAMLQNSHQH